ncbi:hypothetical protein DEU56DRAFT_86923 [Suillus clintonianus]|uniref:uncharacterized protein n=1 Tax=Suillus clintonianus TaxID=1904413 RepID=UPI001B86F0CD|nr:uncharacterized protein DEU56DRAFT_86923 [Suillus clintonianus]KAG2148947.1 hypothetical protein DEU56DRAFT_86923 [Suillus clintonianus]
MGVELVYAFTAMMLASFLHTAAGGNTTCAGSLTQWYTNAVGETACETYQSLRQICNPSYQVPSFRPNTPGDNCDDQVADCCCNSISWALSMLCMNCQWDVDSGSPNGIDAGVGAYGMYLNPTCAPVNQSLPAEVQTAVCNKGIKLANFLYSLFWNNGAWFYVYTADDAQKDEAASNNNMYSSNCANAATSSIPSPSPSPSPTTPIATQPPGTPTPISSAGSTMSSSNIAIQSPSASSKDTATTANASPPSKGTAATTNASQIVNGTNAGITGTMPPASTNNASSVTNSSNTTSPGVIVGAVVGGLVGLCSLLAIFWWRRRNRGISKDGDNAIRQQTTGASPYPITNADVAQIDPSPYGYAFARKQARAMADSPSPVDRIRSLVTSSAPSHSDINDAQGSYSPLFQEADAHESALRHEDAGVYSTLSRVGSGRLPPAYDSNWRSSVAGNAGLLGERATSNGDFDS